MMHTNETKVKIGIKMYKNSNAEKYNYSYALRLFTDAIQYADANDCFVLVQVATFLNVPRKRFSYLAKKYPELKGMYLYLQTILEVNVFDLANANKMPTRLALFLLTYVYGYGKRIKENQSKEFRSR